MKTVNLQDIGQDKTIDYEIDLKITKSQAVDRTYSVREREN
jgi:hypothetical protein